MENELIPVSMDIILHAGNARTKANEALDALGVKDFLSAEAKLKEAKTEITAAHRAQTEVIQAAAGGKDYEPCLLFSHAQDTLMTIMSEVNLTERLIMLFRSFFEQPKKEGGCL